MEIENILTLLGGLALFLFGMHRMSIGLSEATGDRMKSILEKLTSNRFLGILVGAGITAVIQSSSATTVMVVGFVNSGLMTLQQAVWIIMGANVGTTVTGQLITLNAGEFAPIFAILGVVMTTFISIKKVNSYGEVLAGFGILFIGMNMMSSAMIPLRESEVFIQMITSITHPFIAVLVGTLFTALIQSSSASVGILQALAKSGLIQLNQSIYIIFGQNIGTCITAVLASLNANRNAKRTTIIHLAFNLIGTILFMIFIQFFPFVDWMQKISSQPAAQIANTHTIFNIVTTMLLLPWGTHLSHLAEKILPVTDKERDENEGFVPLTFVDIDNIGSVPIAIASLKREVIQMLELSRYNIKKSIESVYENHENYYNKIINREKQINQLNMEMAKYMSKVSILNMSQSESDICNALYKCFSDIERIGDHAMNIVDHSQTRDEKIKKEKYVKEELIVLKNLLEKEYQILLSESLNDTAYFEMTSNEEQIDMFTVQYRQNQIDRLTEGRIDAQDCVIYSQIMTDVERVSDHMMNIIEECRSVQISLNEE